ncbi:MAG: hypothetical protein V1747_05015 [Candidatus Omnitrophota bacterium]
MLFKEIVKELKEHAPMTLSGAIIGIILVFFLHKISYQSAENLFYICHPGHVLLSALTTAAMYKRYQCPADKKKCNPLFILLVGYVGSIGVATVSDSVIPFFGEKLLNMPHSHLHAGFIERPLLINSMALLGIIIAYFNPTTKFPHLGHVLLSTFASMFHILMAKETSINIIIYIPIMVFLFLSVWIPCCFSDIVFPLLFVKSPLIGHDE